MCEMHNGKLCGAIYFPPFFLYCRLDFNVEPSLSCDENSLIKGDKLTLFFS